MYTVKEKERAAKGEVKDIYGTEVTRKLRKMGFKGVIFIRSANDDADSIKKYISAGATGTLQKDSNVQDSADDIIVQYWAWEATRS